MSLRIVLSSYWSIKDPRLDARDRLHDVRSHNGVRTVHQVYEDSHVRALDYDIRTFDQRPASSLALRRLDT